MKNSLRISMFIFTFSVIMSGVKTSFASGTRMKSLGMTSDTYWMLQKDTAYANFNPSYYVQFTSRASFNETSAGVSTANIYVKPVDDLMVVINANGASLSNGDAGTTAYNQFQQLPAALNSTNMAVRENYNVNAAYKMGPMGVGFRYGTADRLDKNVTANTTNEKAVDTYQAGFFMDLGSGMDFDVAYKMTNYAYDQKGTAVAGNEYKAATSDSDITARFNMALSQTNSVHVWLRYNPMDRTDKLAGVKTTYTINKTSAGISDELKFAGNAFAYFGFLYEMISEEKKITGSKTTIDTANLGFTMGAQANLTKNLSMTLGANRVWDQGITTKATGQDKKEQLKDSGAANGNANGTFGLQYKMGHWSLEALVQRSFLTNGPFLITGNSTASWAAEVNITYVFGTEAKFEEEKK